MELLGSCTNLYYYIYRVAAVEGAVAKAVAANMIHMSESM
jgi:hypothetical protein